MTEAPVATRGGSPRLATYETEPQNSAQPTSLIEATPTYRASGLVHGSRSDRRRVHWDCRSLMGPKWSLPQTGAILAPPVSHRLFGAGRAVGEAAAFGLRRQH